jgi:transcriptional regulator
MYTKQQFSLSVSDVWEFVRTKSFGVLATQLSGEVFTSPLPIDLRRDEDDSLFVAGHIARGNEMLKAFVSGNRATITVLGPDSFVPAEWFGVRSRIPTWLYCSVELAGRLEPSDPLRTRDDVITLIDRLEASYVPGSTWTLAEIPDHLSSAYLQQIAGFRLHDLRLRSCFRLNQGKGQTEGLAAALASTRLPACQELSRLVVSPPTIPLK